jgi:hypothetical protein
MVDKIEEIDLNEIFGGIVMLGPALSLLLAQLHERSGSPTTTAALTKYEQLLYSELLNLFDHFAVIAPGMETSPLMKSPEDFKARREIVMQTIVRPDDDDERPRLQINCGRDDCPNKQ